MTEFNQGLAPVYERLAMSDDDLARTVLNRDIETARKTLKDAEFHANFAREYRQTPPGPRPHPEDGGMDHQDWEVAAFEYRDYDEDYEIDKADHELDEADWRLSDLFESKADVESGDKQVTGQIAGMERLRLLETIRRAAREVERRGKEYSGSKELYTALFALQSDRDRLLAAREKTGSNGWQTAPYIPTWCQQGSVFRVNPGGGPLESFGSYTQELELAAGTYRATINYCEMAADAPVRWVNEDWRVAPVNYYELSVDPTGKVTQQVHRRGNGSQQWRVGPGTIYLPIHNYEGVTEYDFTVDDINKLQGIVDEITADVDEVTRGGATSEGTS